jgi:hypothetical protein
MSEWIESLMVTVVRDAPPIIIDRGWPVTMRAGAGEQWSGGFQFGADLGNSL